MKILNHRFVIAVHDLKKSAAFYRDILGFTISQIEDPGWLFAAKENCLIMMGYCQDALDPHQLGDHAYFAYIEVSDINTYYENILSNGGKPKYAPVNKPWGMREFAIQTIDGHNIMFGQQL